MDVILNNRIKLFDLFQYSFSSLSPSLLINPFIRFIFICVANKQVITDIPKHIQDRIKRVLSLTRFNGTTLSINEKVIPKAPHEIYKCPYQIVCAFHSKMKLSSCDIHRWLYS
jgi:hypothetical protein